MPVKKGNRGQQSNFAGELPGWSRDSGLVYFAFRACVASSPCETDTSAFTGVPLDLTWSLFWQSALTCDQGAPSAPHPLCVESGTEGCGCGCGPTSDCLFCAFSATQRDLWPGWVLRPSEGDAHADSDPCQSGLRERHPCIGTGGAH